MPVTTIVILGVILSMFAAFMLVLGAVSLWTSAPERRPAARVEAKPARGGSGVRA
jgi:hypothetical protein